jgi:hypothetical protein
LFGLVEILLVIFVFMIGPFVLGFVFGMIREQGVGLLLLLAVYVLLVLFWQGGLGTPSGPPTYAKAGWFLAFYALPALVGYATAYLSRKKEKIPTIRLLRK